jgi:uncharacterized protein YdaU (DUF1376 family)
MNYYEHHIGDYAEATGHLSFIEDAAYSRMIRKYYATEKPLPADVKAIQRLIGARTKEEKDAVETVLQEFFTLQADGYHQTRCDEVIEFYQAGEPERQAKKDNEQSRLKRHREERAKLFHDLKAVGQNPAYNAPMSLLRALRERYCNAPATQPATLQPPLHVTPPATLATATQSPIPITNPNPNPNHQSQSPIPEDADPFDEIMNNYPDFAGMKNWITANVAATNLVTNGMATWFDLLQGTIRYREYIIACGKVGTQFVLNPQRFFSDVNRPWAQEWNPPIKLGTFDKAMQGLSNG